MKDLADDFEKLSSSTVGLSALCEVMGECLIYSPSHSDAYGEAMAYIADLAREQKEAFTELHGKY